MKSRKPWDKGGETLGNTSVHLRTIQGKPGEHLRKKQENLGYTWTNMEKLNPNLAIWNFVP